MLTQIRQTINRTFAEATGNPAFAGVVGKPLVTPLDYRFRLACGYVPQRNGYRRTLVQDIRQERYRLELEERIGTLLAKRTDSLPDKIVSFGSRPLCVQVPNPDRPAPIAWHSGIDASLDSIPLGVSYGWQGRRWEVWDRTIASNAHLLIAGITGSGKSVLMRAIMAGLVSHVSPAELEIIAIDMKGRSLQIFENAPHLRHGVAYESGTAMALLSALDAELDSRIASGQSAPAICLAVDELTDLLEGDAIAQGWLARIARMGRELGIFILAGTQKPLMGEVGQAKSQFGFRVVGRMRNGQDAQTAAGVAVDADSLYHPGSFYAVTGADKATLFRGLLADDNAIRQACATFRNGSPSALTVREVQADNGRELVKEERASRQAEEDAETLRAEFGEDVHSAKPRQLILALGLNPAGSNWYKGKERVERAMEVISA